MKVADNTSLGKEAIAIVLAAGASTRMKSKTSKLLYPILGFKMVEWAILQARSIAERVIVVVGHQREALQKCVREAFPSEAIEFALQAEARGTADAVRSAVPILEKLGANENTPLFIMGADSILLKPESLQNFYRLHTESRAVLSLMTTQTTAPNAFGRILRSSQGSIEAIVELKDATPEQTALTEVNAGFYLVQNNRLAEALASVSDKTNKAKEFYLTDLVAIARKQGWLVQTVSIEEAEAAGVNTQVELSAAAKTLQRRINSVWMERGVRLLDPETTWIDAQVQLEGDVEVGANVHLEGKTRIHSGSRIASNSIVRDCDVGSGVVVESFCHLEGAKLGRSAKVGPFARLRPGTVLEGDVHIGNFVEIKKSTLKQGVKAGHLSYLGDATVGEESNIGAGTITCNYDGFAKNETVLGKNVFVGSNTSLVAPVEVGDGAIIGAGSVITDNISTDSLAFERSEQQEIKEGAKRFRIKRTQQKTMSPNKQHKRK